MVFYRSDLKIYSMYIKRNKYYVYYVNITLYFHLWFLLHRYLATSSKTIKITLATWHIFIEKKKLIPTFSASFHFNIFKSQHEKQCKPMIFKKKRKNVVMIDQPSIIEVKKNLKSGLSTETECARLLPRQKLW